MVTDAGGLLTEPVPPRRPLLRWPLTVVAVALIGLAVYALVWATQRAGPGYTLLLRVLLFPAVVAVPAVLLVDIVRALHRRVPPPAAPARTGPVPTAVVAGVAGAVLYAAALLVAASNWREFGLGAVVFSPLAVAAGCGVALRLAGAARPWLTGIVAAAGAIIVYLAVEVSDPASAAVLRWSTTVAVAAGVALTVLAADRRCPPALRLAVVAGLPLVSADVPGFELHSAAVDDLSGRGKRLTVVLAPRGFDGDGSIRDLWHSIVIMVMPVPVDFPRAGTVADGTDRWRRVSYDEGLPDPSVVFYLRYEGVLVTVEGMPVHTDEALINRASHSLRRATAKELAAVA